MSDMWASPQLAKTIQSKAKRIIEHYGINPSDQEDVEQELWLGVLRCQRLSNLLSSDLAFLQEATWPDLLKDQVILQTALGIRSYKLLFGHSTCLGQLLDGEPGALPCERLKQRLMRLDVEQVVNRLPVDLRRLCHRLRANSNTARSSHRLIRAQIIRLKHVFEAAHLHEYLSEPN